MALHKRIIIVILRLLPPQTHAAMRVALIKEYTDTLQSHREALKIIKQRIALEVDDIAMFDKWIDDGAIGDKIPILKPYYDFMHRFNITCHDTYVEQRIKNKEA
jgi:hypothetical protein